MEKLLHPSAHAKRGSAPHHPKKLYGSNYAIGTLYVQAPHGQGQVGCEVPKQRVPGRWAPGATAGRPVFAQGGS